MALDTTVAGTTANGYISVATADGFATDDLGTEAAAWTALAVTATKEAAIKRATREIDAYLRSEYSPWSATQALLFPRASVDKDSGGSAIIPRGVQLACYQQAIYLVANAAVIAAAQTRTARNMASASEPSVSFVRDTDEATEVLCLAARHYLSGYRTAARADRVGSMRSLRIAPGFQQ